MLRNWRSRSGLANFFWWRLGVWRKHSKEVCPDSVWLQPNSDSSAATFHTKHLCAGIASTNIPQAEILRIEFGGVICLVNSVNTRDLKHTGIRSTNIPQTKILRVECSWEVACMLGDFAPWTNILHARVILSFQQPALQNLVCCAQSAY